MDTVIIGGMTTTVAELGDTLAWLLSRVAVAAPLLLEMRAEALVCAEMLYRPPRVTLSPVAG